jgi:hypothetical protein
MRRFSARWLAGGKNGASSSDQALAERIRELEAQNVRLTAQVQTLQSIRADADRSTTLTVLEDTLKTLDGKLIAAEKQRIHNVVEALVTGQEVEVTVATADGAEVVLVLSSTDTIRNAKEQYAQHEGTMICAQVLFLETDEVPLADEVAIGSFGSPHIRLLLTIAVEQWVKVFQHDTERTTEWVSKESWLSIRPDDPDAPLFSCLGTALYTVLLLYSHSTPTALLLHSYCTLVMLRSDRAISGGHWPRRRGCR